MQQLLVICVHFPFERERKYYYPAPPFPKGGETLVMSHYNCCGATLFFGGSSFATDYTRTPRKNSRKSTIYGLPLSPMCVCVWQLARIESRALRKVDQGCVFAMWSLINANVIMSLSGRVWERGRERTTCEALIFHIPSVNSWMLPSIAKWKNSTTN